MIHPHLLLLCCILAAAQIVETLHHGSVFLFLRNWSWAHKEHPRWLLRKTARLLDCPFCLSHWAALLVVILAFVAAVHLPGVWGILSSLVVLVLAVTRASNLLNDLTHAWCRSPTDEVVDETSKDDKETQDGQPQSAAPGPAGPQFSTACSGCDARDVSRAGGEHVPAGPDAGLQPDA